MHRNTRVLGHFVPTLLLTLVFCLAGPHPTAANPLTLIPTNAVWKYLDNGSDQGTDWREPFDYYDEDWAQGPAELGYGDSLDGRPEATVVSYGPDPQNKYITTYFRHHFEVADPASITNLMVRLLRDDGGVVYLNGQEIFRSNMTDEEIDYRTLAEVAVTDAGKTTYFSQAVPPYMLYEGENVIAVEIHQFNVGSGDISFALELFAETGPPPPPHLTRGPYLQIGTPTSIIVKWRTDQPMESLVVYGTDPNNLHLLDGDLSPTTEHEVKITGLNPTTKYYYGIDTFDGPMAGGPDYYFITSPTPGKARPTRIWAIGDSGTYGTGQGNALGVRNAYYNYTGARETDVWLLLGDNAYNDGSDNDYQNAVFNLWTSILRKHVAWSTIGNHETYTPLANGR